MAMTAEELKKKVQAGEDVTVDSEDMTKAEPDQSETVDVEGKGDADGAGTESEDDKPKTEGSDTSGGDAADESDDGKQKGEKRKKKSKKKDPRDEKIAELNDKLLRNLAEFENFRNRSEKEKQARFDMGAGAVVEKILPVIDNLERGLDGLSDEEKEEPFAAGIVAVYKQLQTALEELGVAPIEAVGQEFNPDLHQAVMHEEDDSDNCNIVVEELQKGYTYKDTVIRYSMVKVLN